MNYKYVIIDTNLWYHKNFATHKDLTYQVDKKTIITGGIYGFLISIKKWKKLFGENCHFYFLFDNPDTKSNLRAQMVDPTYKLNRKIYSTTFYRGIDFLHLILIHSSSRYTTVYGTGYESDDIAPYILDSLNIDNNNQAIMVSEDMDWSRLISDNVHQYMKGKIFDKRAFHEKYQFYPNKNSVTLYKTIRGDKVDNIPIGIKGLSSKILIHLIDNYKDIYDVFDNLNIIPCLTNKWKKEFVRCKNRLTLNHKLITFFPVNENQVQEFTHVGCYKPYILKRIYESLGFELDKIDYRLYSHLEEEQRKKDIQKGNFFRQPRIKRK